jgi:hypothetical protein
MASTYLSRTPASSGSRTTWTWSAWIKRANLTGTQMVLFGAKSGSSDTGIWLQTDNSLQFFNNVAGTVSQIRTNRLFRDTSAWYHIVCVWDSSNATAGDRMKMYINGVEETSFQTDTNPSQNDNSMVNNTELHQIGRVDTVYYFDGSMAHVHFIDGTAYDASTFGETDATTGIWKPKTAPVVTYGTNGFFLKFENSASFGTDSSGNANNFTVNGTMTQTIDTPSNVFATMNPLDNFYGEGSTSNGNTTYTSGSTNQAPISATLGASSGKYYWEVKFVSDTGGYAMIGVASSQTTANNELGHNSTDYAYVSGTGQYRNNDGYTSYGNTYSTGDIIGVALDLDNNALYFSKNGTWQNSGDPTSGASKTGAISITAPSSTNYGVYLPAVSDFGGNTIVLDGNFGNGYFGTTAVSSAQNPDDGIGIFEYDVPTGYYALNTKAINAQEYD